MRRVITGEQVAQIYNPDPFARPVFRAPVYQTPAGLILLAWLARLLYRLARLACRHPVATLTLALLAFLWVTISWIGIAAIAEHGCGGTCGRKAGYCPERKQTRADTGPTKSRAGRRIVGLPVPLVLLLQAHKAKQEAERMAARQLWHDEGWVFANPDGRPLNPNTDYHEWKALLSEAGVHDGRLHDARHTAATVLAILAVPTPTAMAIMGWSTAASATRYQHVLDSILKGVAGQVGGLLWDDPERDNSSAEDDKDGNDGTTAMLAPV